MESCEFCDIAHLISMEREARDRHWWEQMRTCYREDAYVDMAWFSGTGPEFVAASRGMADRQDVTRHRMYVPMVHVNGDRAVVTMPMNVDMRVRVHGVEADLVTYARALYRAQRRDGRWGLAGLTAVYSWDTLTPSLPGRHLPLDTDELAQLRPSYRMLSYYLRGRGYDMAQDAAGDDRPEQAERTMQEQLQWAGIAVG